jgi:hypothetical protein
MPPGCALVSSRPNALVQHEGLISIGMKMIQTDPKVKKGSKIRSNPLTLLVKGPYILSLGPADHTTPKPFQYTFITKPL